MIFLFITITVKPWRPRPFGKSHRAPTEKPFKDSCEVISWTYGVDFQLERTLASGLRLKLLTFTHPGKSDRSSTHFDPSQTWLSLETPRSQEMLGEEICLPPSLQSASDWKLGVIHTGDLLWDGLWWLFNTVAIFPFSPPFAFLWQLFQIESLAQPEHFPQPYLLAHSQSYATVGWGSVASERLLFDVWIPFTWLHPSQLTDDHE